MAEVSRQQRRRLHREQAKVGQQILAAGLAADPRRAEVVAVARVVLAKLAERENGGRAGEAAGLAHRLAEASVAARPGRAAIACRKGCAYCCHSFVVVLPPEAFRLARAVREGRAGQRDVETVHRLAEPLCGLGPSDRIGRKLPCPLLEDGACCAYADRPLVCRQATSLSLAACIEEYEGVDREGRVEVSSAHLAHSSNAHVVLLGAMRAAGLPTDAFELSAALVVALEQPDAERRWLGGEDVFRQLPRFAQRPPAVDFVAARIAEELAA